MLKSFGKRRAGIRALIALAAIGCKDDCVTYPCPLTFAIELTVTASDTHKPPPNLAIGSPNTAPSTMVCDTNGVCRLPAQPGTYQLVIAAPGYTTQQIEVNVTGTSPGCNTCGHADLQQRTIVLTPS